MFFSFLSGFGLTDVAELLIRLTLGGFFVLARFRYFFDPSKLNGIWFNVDRHTSLRNKMCHCGLNQHPNAAAWFAALVEVLAGLGVVFGLLTVLSAVGLLAITMVGTFCTAKAKVLEQHPVDKIDCVSCYLWRVEGLYIVFAVLIFLTGPGAISLDHYLLGV